MAEKRSVVSMLSPAAWLAILLGLTVQLLILFAKIAAGGEATPLQVFVDVASGVTWSALVCYGIAFGVILGRPIHTPRSILTAQALERLAAGGG